MARPAVSDVIKIRKAIIALNDDDFKDLADQIEIIAEIREEIKKKSKGVTSEEPNNTGNGTAATS